MDEKVCFLFGHAITPYEAITEIEAAVEKHYLEQNIRVYIVGNRGRFDNLATTAIKRLKKKYTDISLLLLLAYHPAEHSVALAEGFDNSYYPPIGQVLRQYAIVQANRYMIDTADTIICYVNQIGNSRNLLEYAQRRKKKENVLIENVAEKML